MMILDKLIVLEEKLDKLVKDYNLIKKERDLLIEENASLLKNIESFEENKLAIKKKVENIITKLDS